MEPNGIASLIQQIGVSGILAVLLWQAYNNHKKQNGNGKVTFGHDEKSELYTQGRIIRKLDETHHGVQSVDPNTGKYRWHFDEAKQAQRHGELIERFDKLIETNNLIAERLKTRCLMAENINETRS